MFPITRHRGFVIAGALLCNIFIWALSGYFLIQGRQHSEQQAQVLAQNIAVAIDQNLTASIDKIDLALRVIAQELRQESATNGINGVRIDGLLASYQKLIPDVEGLRVTNSLGEVIHGRLSESQAPVSYAGRDFFPVLRDHPESGLQVTHPIIGRISHTLVIAFARRYDLADGRFGGVVTATIPVEHFDQVLSSFNIGPKGGITLRNADLAQIARFPKNAGGEADLVGNKVVSATFSELVRSGVSRATYHARTPIDKTERLLTFHRLSVVPLIATVGLASEDYLGQWYDDVRRTCTLGGCFTLLSVVSALLLIKVLNRLANEGNRLAQANGQLQRLNAEQQATAQELGDSERRYSALFANKMNGMAHCRIITDERGEPVDFLIMQINEAGERIMGIAKADLEGHRAAEVIPGFERYLEVFGRVALGGGEAKDEAYLPTTQIYLSTYVFSAQVGEFTVMFSDETESRLAFVEREQFFKLFTASTDLMCIADPKGFFRRTNPAVTETLGYSENELTSRPYIEFIHPDDTQRTLDEMQRQLEAGFTIDFENRYICKDGRVCWLSWRTIFSEQDQTAYATARDVTAKKMLESQLRASEAHYRLLTEDVSDVVWKLDQDYRFTYVSPADERLRGFQADEVLGRSIFEITNEEGKRAAGAQFHLSQQEGQYAVMTGALICELQQICKDGRWIWTEMQATPERNSNGRITGYHGITRDITERKQTIKLEQQLLHSQKLESLGVLAGGIAHDFNNLLMAIFGNTELALMSLSDEASVKKYLLGVEQAAGRAADLTRQMLAYSGKGRFVIENLDLNELVETMRAMLEAAVPSNAAIRLDLQQSLPLLEADQTQMKQVIVNLVTNASEALEGEGGVIDITTRSMMCCRSFLDELWPDENIKEGIYVMLEIADTGCGMDPETLARLFDPFFTTKFTGRGLGLAAVQGIVRGHMGHIRALSERGRGTTFKILLPACAPAAEPAISDSRSQSPKDDRQGMGTVLLVDDESAVRDIGAEMLTSLGYTPITACDGLEAISLFKRTPDIAFVILDLTMPHMGGEQCFHELRRLDPTVKVIISSGYHENEVTRKFVGQGLSGFIQKPYNLSVLGLAAKNAQQAVTVGVAPQDEPA